MAGAVPSPQRGDAPVLPFARSVPAEPVAQVSSLFRQARASALVASAAPTGQTLQQFPKKRRAAYRRSVRRQGRVLVGSAGYQQRLSVVRGRRQWTARLSTPDSFRTHTVQYAPLGAGRAERVGLSLRG